MRRGLLVALIVLASPLAGCLSTGPQPQASRGLVVTGQPALDAVLALGQADQLVGYPDWAVLDHPLEATALGRPFHIPAESVLELSPAHVLDAPHPLVAGPDRTQLHTSLTEAGVQVTELPVEPTLATVAATLWTVANATGSSLDPRAVLDGLRANLSWLAEQIDGLESPRALVLFPAGLTAGTGTDADLLFELAGLRNVAAEAGLVGYRQITDEAVQQAGVDLVIVTATARKSPEEVAAMPMLAGTAVEGRPERVLVVDPSRTMRVGPHLDQAARMVAAWAHEEVDGPRVTAWLEPSKLPACAESTLHVLGTATVTAQLAGHALGPGTFSVPDLPDGHYRFIVRAEGADTPLHLLLSVEGNSCAS